MKKIKRTRFDAPAPIVRSAYIDVSAIWHAKKKYSASKEVGEYLNKLSEKAAQKV